MKPQSLLCLAMLVGLLTACGGREHAARVSGLTIPWSAPMKADGHNVGINGDGSWLYIFTLTPSQYEELAKEAATEGYAWRAEPSDTMFRNLNVGPGGWFKRSPFDTSITSRSSFRVLLHKGSYRLLVYQASN